MTIAIICLLCVDILLFVINIIGARDNYRVLLKRIEELKAEKVDYEAIKAIHDLMDRRQEFQMRKNTDIVREIETISSNLNHLDELTRNTFEKIFSNKSKKKAKKVVRKKKKRMVVNIKSKRISPVDLSNPPIY